MAWPGLCHADSSDAEWHRAPRPARSETLRPLAASLALESRAGPRLAPCRPSQQSLRRIKQCKLAACSGYRYDHATFDMKQKEAAKWGFAAVSGYA